MSSSSDEEAGEWGYSTNYWSGGIPGLQSTFPLFQNVQQEDQGSDDGFPNDGFAPDRNIGTFLAQRIAERIPGVSVTFGDTSINGNGPPPSIVEFSMDNIPANLREIASQFIGAVNNDGTAVQQKASEDAINSLEIVKPSSIKEAERSCSICYDDYDEPQSKEETNTDEEHIGNSMENKYKIARKAVNGDPDILFPADELATNYSRYERLVDSPQGDGSEHVPAKMPCEHIFGRSCLVEWLKSSVSCPLCRRAVDGQPTSTHSRDLSSHLSFRNRSYIPSTWADTENIYDDPEIVIPSFGRIGTSGTVRR